LIIWHFHLTDLQLTAKSPRSLLHIVQKPWRCFINSRDALSTRSYQTAAMIRHVPIAKGWHKFLYWCSCKPSKGRKLIRRINYPPASTSRVGISTSLFSASLINCYQSTRQAIWRNYRLITFLAEVSWHVTMTHSHYFLTSINIQIGSGPCKFHSGHICPQLYRIQSM